MKWIRITFLIISVVVLFVIAYAIINSMVSYKYEMEEPPKLYEINIEFAVGYLKSQITWLWCFLGYVAISIIIILRSMFDRKNNRSKMKRFISLLVTFSFDYQINRWHKNDVGWCRQLLSYTQKVGF